MSDNGRNRGMRGGTGPIAIAAVAVLLILALLSMKKTCVCNQLMNVSTISIFSPLRPRSPEHPLQYFLRECVSDRH